MTTVGIDSIGFYTPSYYLDMEDLAAARQIAIRKLHTGLGQYQMSVPAPDESIVTMAANAAEKALTGIDKSSVDMVIFATESGVDQSKAAGTFVHRLLGLPEFCRVIELKQACYSATAGLQMALAMLQSPLYADKKILLIASDIARYGLATTGESSQGAGAVAMLLSQQPRLLQVEAGSGYHTEDTMDFWRPNYRDEALVDGKHSIDLYLEALRKSWQRYSETTERTYQDHDYFLYHIPVPKLAEKAHQKLAMINGLPRPTAHELEAQIEASLSYSRKVGNCYTASLYIGLLSLLDQSQDLSAKRLGMYSYGSGCVAEFFSVVVQPGYQNWLQTDANQRMLNERRRLSMAEYENFYSFHYPKDGSDLSIPHYNSGNYRLSGFKGHKRLYQPVTDNSSESNATVPMVMASGQQSKDSGRTIVVKAPGKLILSGEHAVVHGAPAIAIAINRYTTTTINAKSQHFSFNFETLKHKSEYTWDRLRSLKARIKRAHHRFVKGELGIYDVLQKPFELLEYAAGHAIELLNPEHLAQQGVNIHTESDIPIGCGMGSSAAGIVSLNHAISRFFRQERTAEEQFELCLASENMQHGASSGVDIMVSLYGGCQLFQQGQSQALAVPSFPLFFINTGRAESSTGECVQQAKKYFDNSALTEQFAAVTEQMKIAIVEQNYESFCQAIRANHRLLCEIGIVPPRVQTLIADLEAAGAVAKVCGAGTVIGNAAGAVLVSCQPAEQSAVAALVAAQDYDLQPVEICQAGVLETK